MAKLYRITLSDQERDRLLTLIKSGTHPARTLSRARILLLACEGKRDSDIAQVLHVGISTVERTRKRFVEGGLEGALFEKPRPGKAPKLTPKQEARLVAVACSDPPEGRTRWTLRLLSQHLVELEVVDAISRECVRRTLKKTCSNPGRSSNGAFLKPVPNSSFGWRQS
jgi:transposase